MDKSQQGVAVFLIDGQIYTYLYCIKYMFSCIPKIGKFN
jgi:hypothetical protein